MPPVISRPPGKTFRVQTLVFTSVAMIAFAANSILCREVLKSYLLDAASFTSIRLLSGALTLLLVNRLVHSSMRVNRPKTLYRALMLFAYAIAFSYAYIDLNVATGALILFGAVQATMMLSGLVSGERPSLIEWCGFVIAVVGFFILIFPGLTAPTARGALLMYIAGSAWGMYSLLGRGSENPTQDSMTSFMLATPLCLVINLLMLNSMSITPRGVLIAVVSGSVTSGCAYVIWYKALKELTAIHASVVQLSVPVLAAFASVLFLSEPLTARISTSGTLILGGIAIGLAGITRRKGIQ